MTWPDGTITLVDSRCILRPGPIVLPEGYWVPASELEARRAEAIAREPMTVGEMLVRLRMRSLWRDVAMTCLYADSTDAREPADEMARAGELAAKGDL
jgi:hypothetical protein